MDKDTIISETKKILNRYNLNYVDVKINNRLSKCLGKTWYNGNVPFLIEYSGKFITEIFDDNVIMDTILHECAHAVHVKMDGYTNHGERWKKIAEELGCDASAISKNVYKTYKYNVFCKKCGKLVAKRNRKTRNLYFYISTCCEAKLDIKETKEGNKFTMRNYDK